MTCCVRAGAQEVLCLAWSSAGFLISGSMDGSVRLWHPSRAACLRTFLCAPPLLAPPPPGGLDPGRMV